MGIKRRKYSKEQKEEIVQRALSSERILALGKEHNISPGLINRWKRQYLDGELNNNTNQEVKKLETHDSVILATETLSNNTISRS